MSNETNKTSPVIEIQKVIKERLLSQNNSVRESYIEVEVKAKMAARLETVKKAILEIATLQKEIQKIKPDQVSYGADGKISQELYSKDLIEKKNKAVERLEKVEKALSKSFDTADYTDLENLIK